jgi:hypothetical protein
VAGLTDQAATSGPLPGSTEAGARLATPDEVRWVRSGECCRCGECCRGDPFLGQEGEPAIQGACPLLRHADGVYACSDRQHPYYLSGCNVWQTLPDQIADKPGCSYTFAEAAA